MRVLGVSGLYHDAAAALVEDGRLVAAAQEERFTRVRHDASLPRAAMGWCLEQGEVDAGGLDAVVYYEKPLLTFLRLLRTRFQVAPRGFATFRRAMQEWTRTKLWVGYALEGILTDLGQPRSTKVWYGEHHLSHAASAFFPSPFDAAAILTFDGVGEFATTSIGLGAGNRVQLLEEIDFPDSIGLLYSTFTVHCGFRANSGEYKLMGLAPFGEPRFAEEILRDVVTIHPDGSFHLDQRWFDYRAGGQMASDRFRRRFGPARRPEDPLTQHQADLARSVQHVTEELVLAVARRAAERTGQRRAVLAGGVALNCVSNARLLADGPFDEIWIQPAAGDAGGAIGAAFHGYHHLLGRPRVLDGAAGDGMAGCRLGPAFAPDAVAAWLDERGYPYERLTPATRAGRIAELLAEGEIVAVLQGPMEFGPRALGGRSILADPRSPEVQTTLNLRTKQRESFRPFAPAVLAEHAADWFDLRGEAPYMLLTAPVAASRRVEVTVPHEPGGDVFARVREVRSTIPAVTHVDGSARVQTVDADRAPDLHAILAAFHERTGCPVLVNTSFNVRGEPIVASPEDAYRCFATTDIDRLVLEDCLLDKAAQPPWSGPVPVFAPD